MGADLEGEKGALWKTASVAGGSGEVGELCDLQPSCGDGLIPKCNGKLLSFQQASDTDQVILERFYFFYSLAAVWSMD